MLWHSKVCIVCGGRVPANVSECMPLTDLMPVFEYLKSEHAVQVSQAIFRPSHIQLLHSAVRHHRAPMRNCELVISSYAAEVSLNYAPSLNVSPVGWRRSL